MEPEVALAENYHAKTELTLPQDCNQPNLEPVAVQDDMLEASNLVEVEVEVAELAELVELLEPLSDQAAETLFRVDFVRPVVRPVVRLAYVTSFLGYCAVCPH